MQSPEPNRHTVTASTLPSSMQDYSPSTRRRRAPTGDISIIDPSGDWRSAGAATNSWTGTSPARGVDYDTRPDAHMAAALRVLVTAGK